MNTETKRTMHPEIGRTNHVIAGDEQLAEGRRSSSAPRAVDVTSHAIVDQDGTRLIAGSLSEMVATWDSIIAPLEVGPDDADDDDPSVGSIHLVPAVGAAGPVTGAGALRSIRAYR